MAGASIADCLEGALHTVLGQGFYHQPAAQPDAVDSHLINVAEELSVPGEVHLFVRQHAARDEMLRRYLDQLDPAVRGELSVVALDNSGNVVTDTAQLRSMADWLDLPVHAPLTVGHRDGLIPVDQTARQTALPPIAYQVLPSGIAAQRQAALEALRDTPPAAANANTNVSAAMANVHRWLDRAEAIRTTLGLSPAVDAPLPGARPTHTTMYAVGTYLARFGSTTLPALVDLLHHTELTPQQVTEAIGGPDATTSATPTVVANHLLRNPGHAALVTASDQLFWLLSDAAGAPHWVDPRSGRTPVVFDVDGAQDWRTAVLERSSTQVLMVDATGRRTELDRSVPQTRTPTAPISLPTDARAGEHGVVLIGAWPPGNQTKYGLSNLDSTNLPVIAVDVRQLRQSLEPTQLNALRNASLRHFLNNARPIIVSTAANSQVAELAKQFGGALLSRVPTKLDSEWQLHVPDAGLTTTFADPQLTQAMVEQAAAALAALGPVHEPLPPVLVELLSFNTYDEAGAHFRDNFEKLRDPVVGEAMRVVAARFPQDNPLQVFRLATEISQRAPFLAGATPLEPAVRDSINAEPPLAPNRPIDLTFVFDYLTSRGLPAQADTQPVGAHQTRLLWDGLLFQAMLGQQLTRAEAVTLARGVGEVDAERARRVAGAPETSQAHAMIFDALGSLVEKSVKGDLPGDGVVGPRVNWKAQLSIADCLTGADRVPWHFRIKEVLVPHFKQLGVAEDLHEELTEIRDEIYFCH
ncbi:hypothetical protein GCM10027280_62210 [Micromonospora polyrhachis]|uniref:Uncharacterized protein n=1 Tax=Micromonospora polyrhachis TaxID=1282883 RepID=A0A7W7WPN1_9ACTN|nr:hypothetical protein [Micromonospora polyrhachis]MBB4958879.1 hypothetical protein [Micromonospora polyrhachis]